MPKTYDEITSDDISFILEFPWELTGLEWQLNEEDTKIEMRAAILEKLKSAAIEGYAKIWRTATHEPIAILGARILEDKKFRTFFVASKHMEEHALKLSFEMRQILKEQAQKYKGKGYTLALFSESHHPKQLTWFRFLGFKYVPEKNRGNFRYFEYVPRI